MIGRTLRTAASIALPAILMAGAGIGAPQDADVNRRNADGSTPLQWAVYEGDVAEVRRLLDAGADVALANDYGATPMGLAAEVANTEILNLLLKAGANADSANPEGMTALMAVARTGNVAAATAGSSRATVDAREGFGGQTALMWASARRHPEMIEFLISRGAAIDARSAVRDYQRHIQAEGRPRASTPAASRRCCTRRARTAARAWTCCWRRAQISICRTPTASRRCTSRS
jgi:ankyrin repeat protein